MAEQKVRIEGKEATLFRDGTPPIYIMPDGKFAVCLKPGTYGRTYKFKNSLREVERLIASLKRPVALMTAGSEPEKFNVVEWTDSDVLVSETGAWRDAKYSKFYLYDAKAVAKLAEIEKKREAAYEKYAAEAEAVIDTLAPITRSEFLKLLEDKPGE